MAHLELYRPRRESWWERAKRSLTLGPWNPRDREISRYFGGTPVNSGVSVNEETVMSYSAVWAAVNLVAGHISSVPLVLYKLEGEGKKRFTNHPLYRLVHDRPNPLMGSAQFRRTVQTQKMVWGEGYAEIERDAAGRPVALWPLMSYQMAPFFEGGRLRYRYRNPSGNDVIFDPADVIHLRAHSENGINGVGPVRVGRESFGLAIATERFGGSFFGNNTTFGGVVTYPAGINATPQAKEDNRKAIEARHMGPDRAYRLLTLYEGATVEMLGVPPNQAQFLETRMFQVEEVARWFNIPPHKLKHLQRTSYNSIEHQSIEYVTDALDPDWVLWEQELNLKLVSSLEYTQQRIEHVREGMLRGDSSSRSDLQTRQFSVGGLTPNEVRQMENRNPVEGGDEPYVSLQNIPMSLAHPYWESKIALDKANAEKALMPPPAPPAPGGPDADRFIEELNKQFAVERDRASKAEERYELKAAEVIHAQMALELAQRDQKIAEEALAQANTSLHDAASRELALREEVRRGEQETREQDVIIWHLSDVAKVLDQDRKKAWVESLADRDARRVSEQAVTDAERERDAVIAQLAEVTAERDGAIAGEKQFRSEANQWHTQWEEMVALCKESDVKAEEVTKQRDAVQAEAESLRTDVARARADLATELDNQRKQKAATLAAMRSLFVDATERLLTKEALAARKHQATAEKLRAWVDTFYPMHEETVRYVLRPAVTALTAVTGADPAELLERLVAEHMTASRQTLMRVLDSDDEDMRAAVLERTLRRWEEERAELVADALVREGMGQ